MAKLPNYYKIHNDGLAVTLESIYTDLVSVVRCKDCEHKKHLQGARNEAIVCGLGWGLSGIVAEEDFCSYGKRRADDGK